MSGKAIIAPHTGQSSQLLVDQKYRNAQSLLILADRVQNDPSLATAATERVDCNRDGCRSLQRMVRPHSLSSLLLEKWLVKQGVVKLPLVKVQGLTISL